MPQEQLLVINRFNGGISSGSKRGIQGSFRFARGCNLHQDPDKLATNPASTKESGSVVVDLPMFGVNNTVNTHKFFLGDAGKVYKRTPAGAWSVLSTLSNAQGMGFFSGTNLIYLCSGNTQYTLNPTGGGASSDRSLNTADYHPVEAFLDKVFIGNGREMISTDGSGIASDSDTVGGGVSIDFNYKIRCLRNLGNWLFIGATSDNSSDARYFLWDGFSADYNYARTLKGEDGINAVEIADDGTILVFAGKKGQIYQLVGVDAPLVKLKQVPRVEKDKTIEVYPGSVTNYQGHAMFAFSTGTSLTAEKGAYSWSSTDKNYPKVLNFDYAISSGTTTGTSLKVGCLLAGSSTDLFIGWKDGSTYGVDIIDGTGAQSSTLMETLIHDADQPFRVKHYKRFKIKLAKTLATGEKLDLYYKDNRGSWTLIVNGTESNSFDFAVDGAIREKSFNPNGVRANELEVKTEWTNSSSTGAEIDDIIVSFVVEPDL